MLRIVTAIDRCISRLDTRIRLLSPEYDLTHLKEDVESLASGRASHHTREIDRLREKVLTLELENKILREKLSLNS